MGSCSTIHGCGAGLSSDTSPLRAASAGLPARVSLDLALLEAGGFSKFALSKLKDGVQQTPHCPTAFHSLLPQQLQDSLRIRGTAHSRAKLVVSPFHETFHVRC